MLRVLSHAVWDADEFIVEVAGGSPRGSMWPVHVVWRFSNAEPSSKGEIKLWRRGRPGQFAVAGFWNSLGRA